MAALMRFVALSMCLLASVANADVAYVGATLIDGTGETVIEDGAIVVDGSRIAYVGPSGNVPETEQLVDVTGKFITPGFIDTHVHFMESSRIHMDAAMRALDGDLTEADDVAWLKERQPYTLSRYICSGVTTVVSLGGPIHIEFGAQAMARELDHAPRVLIAGGPTGNSGFEWIFDGEHATFSADTAEEITAIVRDFHARGADAIKLGYLGEAMGVDTGVTPEQYVPVLKAAAEAAHELGMPVLTHVMAASEFEPVVDSDLDAFAHITFDEPISDVAISKVVERGIKVAPTIAVFPRMIDVYDRTLELTDIEQQCSDPEVLETYFDYPDGWLNRLRFQTLAWVYDFMLGGAEDAIVDSVQRLHAAGAEFIIGSDAAHVGTPHGVAMHVEMQMLEDAGLPPATLIRAATYNAAELLGKLEELGTLTPGKQADFLILDANPLETIRNAQYIDTVVKGGMAISQSGLQAN